MDDSHIANLFLSPWTLFLVHSWVLLPAPFAACAGTKEAGWTSSGIVIRLIAIIAGLLVGGFAVEGVILELTARFVDAPRLIYAVLGLAPLAGAIAAYQVSKRTTAWLVSRKLAA
jgi:hypothetical protein